MSIALYSLASLEQIKNTPSRQDGIPADLEEDLRVYGCKLIQQAGILLKQYVFYPFSFLSRMLKSHVGSKWPWQLRKYSSKGFGMSHR